MANDTILFAGQGSTHRQVEVIERRGIRYLRFGKYGGWQGALDLNREDRLVFPYQRAFASVVHTLPEVRRFLALGVGTGTALRTVASRPPAARLYGIDVDEVVLELAVRYFGCPASDETCYWVGDGVSYLFSGRATDLFDLIFVDTYLADRMYDPCLDPGFPAALH
ncbi:MAG: spermidine synthase, partial [Alicyclobacillus sp.]|nr:spermidine synthase [Alicyclobacillus sp.]